MTNNLKKTIMKKLILLTVLTFGMLSCSNDDQPTPIAQSQLEIDVKKCVDAELAAQSNKSIPPVGLTLCDCVQTAIDNNK